MYLLVPAVWITLPDHPPSDLQGTIEVALLHRMKNTYLYVHVCHMCACIYIYMCVYIYIYTHASLPCTLKKSKQTEAGRRGLRVLGHAESEGLGMAQARAAGAQALPRGRSSILARAGIA